MIKRDISVSGDPDVGWFGSLFVIKSDFQLKVRTVQFVGAFCVALISAFIAISIYFFNQIQKLAIERMPGNQLTTDLLTITALHFRGFASFIGIVLGVCLCLLGAVFVLSRIDKR